MKKTIFIFIFLGLSIAYIIAQEKKDESKFITNSLILKGLVEKPTTFSLEDLKKMPLEEVNDYKITNHNGEVKRQIASFKGIAIQTLLNEAKVKMKNPKDRGKYFIIVSASDGYQVIFSFNELMFADTKAYLALEADGKALESEGKIALYTTSDRVTGPRHVKWVKMIEVKKI